MGDGDDCLAMCGGCAADTDGGCGEVKRAWAEAGRRAMTATATEAARRRPLRGCEAATARLWLRRPRPRPHLGHDVEDPVPESELVPARGTR